VDSLSISRACQLGDSSVLQWNSRRAGVGVTLFLEFLSVVLVTAVLFSAFSAAQAAEQTTLAAVSDSVTTELGSKAGTEAESLKGEALATAKLVVQAYPEDPLVYALLGSAFYNTGQAETSARHLRKCLELNPRQAEAYQMLARIAYDQGKPEEAAGLCQKALDCGPATPDVLNLLGRALLDAGRMESAIRALQQATALPRPVGESFYLLGQAQMQAGDYESAKGSFLRATALVPDYTQAFFGLYTACVRLGQDADARRFREQFQKLESMDRKVLRDRSTQEESLSGVPLVRKTVARTLFGAGQVYQAHRESEKAVALMRRAALLDADNLAYRAALESHFNQQKSPEQALGIFEQLVAEQADNPLNYYFLGRVRDRLQQWEAAERAFRKTQDLLPAWSGGYRGLAEMYLRTNTKLPEALKLAQKVVELEPAASSYYLLAVACLKTRDRAGALQAVKRAVELSPDDKRYRDLLEQLQAASK